MKRQHVLGWVGMVALLVGLNAVMMIRNLSSAADIKRIQYKVVAVTTDTATLQATLDTYGNAGWELVIVAMGDIQAPHLIFKKEV